MLVAKGSMPESLASGATGGAALEIALVSREVDLGLRW